MRERYGFREGLCPVAESIARRTLALPVPRATRRGRPGVRRRRTPRRAVRLSRRAGGPVKLVTISHLAAAEPGATLVAWIDGARSLSLHSLRWCSRSRASPRCRSTPPPEVRGLVPVPPRVGRRTARRAPSRMTSGSVDSRTRGFRATSSGSRRPGVVTLEGRRVPELEVRCASSRRVVRSPSPSHRCTVTSVRIGVGAAPGYHAVIRYEPCPPSRRRSPTTARSGAGPAGRARSSPRAGSARSCASGTTIALIYRHVPLGAAVPLSRSGQGEALAGWAVVGAHDRRGRRHVRARRPGRPLQRQPRRARRRARRVRSSQLNYPIALVGITLVLVAMGALPAGALVGRRAGDRAVRDRGLAGRRRPETTSTRGGPTRLPALGVCGFARADARRHPPRRRVVRAAPAWRCDPDRRRRGRRRPLAPVARGRARLPPAGRRLHGRGALPRDRTGRCWRRSTSGSTTACYGALLLAHRAPGQPRAAAAPTAGAAGCSRGRPGSPATAR